VIAKVAIEESVPYLKSTDTVAFALDLMEEFKLEHLPVVDGKKLTGVISEQQLLDCDDMDMALSQLPFPLINISISEDAHLFDAMKAGYDCNSSILPVANKQGNYIGLISPKSLLIKLSEYNFVKEKGGIFVLEMDNNNYSLAEIARLVEANNALVLSVATSVMSNPQRMQVTLKVNTLDLTFILATFERYEYNIVSVFHQTEQIDQLKERFDALMNYLNI
jgi:acetoin utilization protein AcuB